MSVLTIKREQPFGPLNQPVYGEYEQIWIADVSCSFLITQRTYL
jgi:hypothetical protein